MRNMLFKRTLSFVLPAALSSVLWMPQSIVAQETEPVEKTSPAEKTSEVVVEEKFPQGVLFPYSLLDVALNGRIDRSGNVDYLALKGNDALEMFVRATQTADLTAFPAWKVTDEQGNERLDRSAELVFWINAYNAHFLKTVSDAYPIKFSSDIPNLHTAKSYTVAGQTYSLQELREKIVKMDARAFFALTDGTQGGPMLAPMAYRWTGLSQLLDAAVSSFVNDPRNVELTRIQNEVLLSEFFKEADPYFESNLNRGRWGGVRYLLMTYTKQNASRKYFTTNDYRIDFKPKNQTLNNIAL